MKNLKWRLSKLPNPDEVRELVKDKIITQEEARQILFSEQSEERDTDSLKEEIKFLRELINKMSTRSTIIENIRYIEKPYAQRGWYDSYQSYCGGNSVTGTSQQYMLNSTNGVNYSYSDEAKSFNDISTF